MKTRLSLLFIACSVLAAGDARAWSPISPEQPAWSGPAPYHLNSAGSADLGGFAETEAVVRKAFDDWGRVECSSLHTDYQGMTSARPMEGGETGVVGWLESGWGDDPNAIGITGPSWQSGGAIQDAQMAMNGVDFTWTTDSGSGGRVNAYSITLHESGHYFGLGHSERSEATMYYAYSGGIDSLTDDDERGICTLYAGGGGGPVGGCSADSDCASGQRCVGGMCVAGSPGPGGGAPGGGPGTSPMASICGACSTDADCGSGKCLAYSQGMFCGRACTSDTECSGDRCETITDGSKQCIRRNASGSPDCTAPAPTGPGGPGGGPGTGPGGTTPMCASDAECGAGMRCVSGTCQPGASGALGDPCMTNDECTSVLCAVDVETNDSFCTQLCDSARPCPGGFACEDAGGGIGACKPTAAGVGDRCNAPADCSSNLCAEGEDGERYCTRRCETDACPSGFRCIATDDNAARVCAPGGAPGPQMPATPSSCAVGGRSRAPLFALMLVAFFALRKRRRT